MSVYPNHQSIKNANPLTDDEIVTRIFLVRSSDVTSIMIASLKWVSSPILKRETKKFGSYYYQDCWWIEGKLQLIVEDYLEKRNLKSEQLINSLNQFTHPVVGYPNDLFAEKLTSGYEPIIVNFELPEEYRQNEQLEIRDIISHLYSEKRIDNQSGMDLTSALARDCMAIAIRTFKRSLITDIHHYTEPPFLRSDSV